MLLFDRELLNHKLSSTVNRLFQQGLHHHLFKMGFKCQARPAGLAWPFTLLGVCTMVATLRGGCHLGLPGPE